MSHGYNEKREKRNNGNNRTAQLEENHNTGRKRKLKYLEVLEADPTEQKEIKEKLEMNTLEEQENFTKSNCPAKISSSEYIPLSFPLSDNLDNGQWKKSDRWITEQGN